MRTDKFPNGYIKGNIWKSNFKFKVEIAAEIQSYRGLFLNGLLLFYGIFREKVRIGFFSMISLGYIEEESENRNFLYPVYLGKVEKLFQNVKKG